MGIGITDTAAPTTRLSVTFYGVRGSTACQGDEIARYGGNTSCVAVDIPGHDPIMFDIGTGARYLGNALPDEVPYRGTCLLSHPHWDHIQGLPFFPPLLRAGSHLDVFAPVQDDGETVGDVVASMLRPPLFPVGLDAFPGTVAFHAVGDETFAVGDVKVTARLIPHLGNTLGYRVEWNGASVAYLSDHQQPVGAEFSAPAAVRELCEGVDLLIHDAQYTPAEFEVRPTWGHCTAEYATWLAQVSGVRQLALFHHDPTHTDEMIDAMVAAVAPLAGDVDVWAAREGLTVAL